MSKKTHPSPSHTAYIALGSNLGNREQNIRSALESLGRLGIKVEAVSSLIETDPVGGPAGQGRYLNGAARLKTTLEPQALLEAMLEVERQLGRTRETGQKNLPRIIDLDLLLFDDRMIGWPSSNPQSATRTPQSLVLPHPRLHERLFVLKPLAEIAREIRHPALKRTMGELHAMLEKGKG